MISNIRHSGYIVAVTALTVVVDQATKAAALTFLWQPPGRVDVTSFFSFRLGFNSGISFGLFQSTFATYPGLLIAFTTLIAIVMIGLAIMSRARSEAIASSLISGGAIGNIIDRVRAGAVTDFLDFHWRGWHWPTFNFADVAISLGVVFLLLSALNSSKAGNSTSLQSHDGVNR